MSELLRSFRLNERLSVWISHAIVSVMMACFAASLVQVGQRLSPGWDGAYLIGAGFVVALEALYTERLVRNFSFLSRQWFACRFTEWAVILIGLKAILYWLQGFDRFWADVAAWPASFAGNFFGGEYPGALLVVVIIWATSWWFSQDLAALEGDVELLGEAREVVRSNRAEVRQRLAMTIFVVGAIVVVCVTLAHADLRPLGVKTPALRGSALNVLLYFVLGLALMSQSQFAILRARWSLDRIPISQKLASRWAAYSIAVLVGLAVMASLLPTGYSLNFLDTVGYVIGITLAVLSFLLYLIATPIALLVSWALSLLGLSEMIRSPVEPPPVLPPSAATEAVTPVPWLELFKSLVFWIVLLGVIGVSFYHYLHQHPELAAALRQLPGWRWLSQRWRWLWQGLLGVRDQLAVTVEAGLRRLRPPARNGPAIRWGFISLRRLSPRERVLFFYQAMVRRGGERGIPRRPSQTPYEYANPLEQVAPEAGQDIAALTDAFVEARYSRHEITTGQAGRVRQSWERVRQALRARR